MIRDKNNIFERVENFHADLAWNYPPDDPWCLYQLQSINQSIINDQPGVLCCLPQLQSINQPAIINLAFFVAAPSSNQSSITNLAFFVASPSCNQSINHQSSTWRSLLPPPPVPPPRLFPITVTVFQSSDILPEDFQRLCNQLELSCIRAVTFSIGINY